MYLNSYSLSDVGLVRKNNEDSTLIDTSLGLYVLSDGMGGHAGGEVASKITVVAVQSFFARHRDISDAEMDKRQAFPENITLPAKKLIYSIMFANSAIMKAATKKVKLTGMGSTVVAIHQAGDELFLAHVGDSRIYLLRHGLLRMMTEDHSVYNEELKKGLLTPEQLEKFPFRNHLARALGHLDKAMVDLKMITPRKDDFFLLCSDGLTDMVKEGDIADIIVDNFNDLKRMAELLVEKAKQNGGRDNISIVLLRVDE